ncbi:MAG: RNA helicase, partial [Thiobacillus sp.]
YGDRPPRNEAYRGADAQAAPKAEVNGNSVEYWEKREREAKAKAASPRSYGDRGNSARHGQPRSAGNENRGGGNRVGVRGRFKD